MATSINSPNTAILDTVDILNGVMHCVQQNYLTKIRAICEEQASDLRV